ncbi:MAG: GH36 C-terminal domain-containing protein, partial [Bryobacteraceae bacterium]
LRGLDKDALYKLAAPDGKLESAAELSGAYLMQAGVHLRLRGDYDAAIVILHRVGEVSH